MSDLYFLIGPFPASFSLCPSFENLPVNLLLDCPIIITDDWIRAWVLCCHKRPLFQICHNDYPKYLSSYLGQILAKHKLVVF